MTKLYGSFMSRAGRSLWALEEAGVKFEHVPLGFAGGGEWLPTKIDSRFYDN